MITQLFCVPHAGGSARVYRRWVGLFGDRVDVVPLELAGRGTRAQAPAPQSIMDAAENLVTVLQQQLTASAYGLLGHSMGGLIAYEMAARLAAGPHPAPGLLIVAGRNPPHLGTRLRALERLTDEALLSNLVALGGAPPALTVSLARRFFLPTLQADLSMVEAYRHCGRQVVPGVPILVVAGRADPLVDLDRLAEWGRYTSATCRVDVLAGGHFFLHERPDDIAAAVAPHLAQTVPDTSSRRLVSTLPRRGDEVKTGA